MNTTDAYLAGFDRLNGPAPAWVRELRQRAMDGFGELGFPTPRLEDWKYTNVAPIAETSFRPGEPSAVDPSRLAPFHLGRDLVELVFVNGGFAAELSSVRRTPSRVRVESLASALADGRDLEGLGQLARWQDRAFTALNTAFLEDGAAITFPEGSVEVPIHLLFVSAPGAEPTVSHPRVWIDAGAGSRATVIETYASLGRGAYFTNAVTEIVLGEGAIVEHYKIQRESVEGFHVATIEARQAARSQFTSASISLGGRLARNDIATTFQAEAGECVFDGLYLASDRQHVDHHTAIDHASPRCRSRELYKGILDGRATGVFNGKVWIRPGAQSSDAHQVNKNLLLSEEADVNTKPELEIFADDVKCGHGATVGRLDENALFYLRSRGIGEASARGLLIYGFASELVGRIRVPQLRMRLEEILLSRFRETLNGEASS